MDGQAIIAVSAAVVALTSLAKWAGLRDTWGPLASILFSLLGVLVWVYSKGTYQRALLFDFFAGWITVATSAAGIYGYTRSLPAAVTVANPRSAMPGAFQGPTSKPDMTERRE